MHIGLAALLLLGLGCTGDGDTSQQGQKYIGFNGPYLGMSEPGTVPLPFAPQFFQNLKELHTSPVFSPDGSEIVYGQDHGICRLIRTEDAWEGPFPAMLQDEEWYRQDPSIVLNGERLIFFSNRPTSSGGSARERIWISEKTGTDSRGSVEWSEPYCLEGGVNALHPHWGASMAVNQSLYFGASRDEDGPTDIYYAVNHEGRFQAPVRLGAEINQSATYEECPFVDPHERFLLFTRTSSDWRQRNIYISCRDSLNGTWGLAEKTALSYKHQFPRDVACGEPGWELSVFHERKVRALLAILGLDTRHFSWKNPANSYDIGWFK